MVPRNVTARRQSPSVRGRTAAHIVLACGLVCPIMSCGAAGDDRAATISSAPSLVPLWTISVLESDSLYLAAPSGFNVDGSSENFLVADRYHSAVFIVDRSGVLHRAVGRRGRGPGEFLVPRSVFGQDSLIVVSDATAGGLTWFDRSSFELRGTRPVSGFASGIAGWRNGWVVGALSIEKRTGAIAIVRDGRATAEHTFSPWPALYRRSEAIPGIFTSVFVATWMDSVAVLYQAADTIYVYGADWDQAYALHVPAISRRGATLEPSENFDALSYPEMFARFSAASLLHRTPAGGFMTAHFDQAIRDGNVVDLTVWVSVTVQPL